MTLIPSLSAPASVAVIGSAGGIGSAFVSRLSDDERVAAVYALSRSPATEERATVRAGHIDVLDEETVREAARHIGGDGPLDLVLVTTGILHSGNGIQPEKRLIFLSLNTHKHRF